GSAEMADARDAGLQGRELGRAYGCEQRVASSGPVAELRRPYLVDAEGFGWRLHPGQGEEGAGAPDAGRGGGSLVDAGRGGCSGRSEVQVEGTEQRTPPQWSGGLP